MKTIWIGFSIAFCFWMTPLQLHAQGYLLTNGVSYYGYQLGLGDRINVADNPSDVSSPFSPYTQFYLNPVGETQPASSTNTFSFNELTDVGVRVFLVHFGDAISFQPILSQSWTELQLSSSYVFQPGVPFYVGLYTGYEFAPPYPPYPPYQYLGPVFGWAELENVNGAIQMLNGAAEYGGGGIYAGTQNIIQPVPEPAIMGLLALVGAPFVFLRRKTF